MFQFNHSVPGYSHIISNQTKMACLQCRKAKKKCIFNQNLNKCERCHRLKQACSLSVSTSSSNPSINPPPTSSSYPTINPPLSINSTHKVAGDKSQVADVCKKRSTMHLATSLGVPTSTHIQSQIYNLSVHHNLKLGQRWQPPSHFPNTVWKQMAIDPLSIDSTHKVAGDGDKSQVADVCKKRSTMHLASSLGVPTSSHIQSQIYNLSVHHNLKLGQRWQPPSHFPNTVCKQMAIDPLSIDSTHKVAGDGDKSQVADVCKKRSTMHLATSLGVPMNTHIQSQICNLSTHHHLKPDQRWQPPSHFPNTVRKQMTIDSIPPWHFFKSSNPNSKQTIVAHKACSCFNSNQTKKKSKK